jgi:predicted dienelactone hydrolase
MRPLTLALILTLIPLTTRAAKPRPPAEPTAHVGLAERVFHPKTHRNWRGDPHEELRATIWYPAVDTAIETHQFIGPPGNPLFDAGSAAQNAELAPSLSPFPLILLSHGSGGSATQLAWLGAALARAGYIAVAVDHPGNNFLDGNTPEGFVLWWERATDLSNVLDGMLADPEFGHRIDDSRIGAAGFSIGGETVLALAGAQADISEITNLCHTGSNKTAATEADHGDRDTTICHVPEMRSFGSVDDVIRAARKTSGESLARSGESYRDPRIRAVFAIAPAPVFTLTQESLHNIKLPVEIVVGSADRIAAHRDNADYVHAYLRGSREAIIPNAIHYTFLDTCTPAGKTQFPTECTDDPLIDRTTIHTQVSTEAINFFNRALHL